MSVAKMTAGANMDLSSRSLLGCDIV